MSPADTAFDPRPQFAAALDQTERQLDALTPTDLDRPSPCDEFDVRTLVAHLVAVLRKLAVVTDGGDMTQVPDPATDVEGHEVEAFRQARAELDRRWTAGDGLDRDHVMAWGTMTGREMLDAYSHEFIAHDWDLARITGRGDDLDPELAVAALDWYRRNVPADDRSDGGPFAPEVAVDADAGPYTRLAGFVGRRV